MVEKWTAISKNLYEAVTKICCMHCPTLRPGILGILVKHKNALDISEYVVSVNWKISVYILSQFFKKRED